MPNQKKRFPYNRQWTHNTWISLKSTICVSGFARFQTKGVRISEGLLHKLFCILAYLGCFSTGNLWRMLRIDTLDCCSHCSRYSLLSFNSSWTVLAGGLWLAASLPRASTFSICSKKNLVLYTRTSTSVIAIALRELLVEGLLVIKK